MFDTEMEGVPENSLPIGDPRRRGRKPGFKEITSPTLPETMSVQLPNKKQELFARFVANGETYIRAYELAGYSPSTANASTMANKPEVAARIEALKKEKEDRDLRFEIELRKANLDPETGVDRSRQIAEWTIKTVLDLFYENVRLAQMAGQFSSAQASLESIAKIMGLLDPPNSKNSNDKSPPTQVGIAIYQDAARQLADGGGVSIEGPVNPLAPAIPSPANAGRK